jgi:hypothetical protein
MSNGCVLPGSRVLISGREEYEFKIEDEVTPLSLLEEEPLVPFCGLFLFNATIAYVCDMKSPDQDISRKRRAKIGYTGVIMTKYI